MFLRDFPLTLAARGDWFRHMYANCVHYGDALEVLRGLPPGLVQCCVTSPPYWGLRDYSVAGSGTTGEAALKHGRDCLLIELNRDYEELIRGRLGLFYNS